MSFERANCLICGKKDVLLDKTINGGNTNRYRCSSCGDYYACNTMAERLSKVPFTDYLSFQSSRPRDEGEKETFMYIKYTGNEGISITYETKDRFE